MLFEPGRSRLHRASPLTKLALVFAVLAMLPLWPAPVLLVALLICLGCGFASGFGAKLLWRVTALMVPTGIALVVVQGTLIPQGAQMSLGPIRYYPAGMAYAALVFLRLVLLLTIGLTFVMTTRANDLARAFDAKGLPPAISYLLTAPLSLVDTIAEESRQVRDSLHLRGLPSDGMRGRLRLLVAMTTPLMRNLIIEAPARAELLEMRGFRALPRRSLLNPIEEHGSEIWLRRGLVLIGIVQIGALAL